MDNKSYIRDEVRKLRRLRQIATQSVMPKRSVEKRAFMTTFLGSCILMLTIVTLCGMVVKHGNVFAGDKSARVTRNSAQITKRVRPDLHMSHISQRDGDALNDRVESMESKVKLWVHRQWLMSLAINENANIAKGIERTYHGNSNTGFITFDETWRMSKIPDTMSLTQEQRDKIRNGAK